MRRIGIDVGSTYTKYCVLEDGASDGGAHGLEMFTEKTPVRQKEYFADRLEGLRLQYGDCAIVTCGYGRKNAAHDRTVTELTALAKGAGILCPEADAVLDIGGQDTKLIRQEGGRLKAFFTNDRCAAGCGLFLSNTLRMLGMDFGSLDLAGCGLPALKLSSVCAVFAQTEIVELIAAGIPEKEIIQAVIVQILGQAKMLLGKTDCKTLALSGGLTNIPGIGPFAGLVLDRQVAVPEHGAYVSALGCAMMAE